MQGVAGLGCPRASSGGVGERMVGFKGGVSGVAVLRGLSGTLGRCGFG